MADPNTPTKAPGVRARVRAELTSAIKSSARSQLATEGAASLSLRAIARELEMASSAIYRYFSSRDELLTALIIDAYDAVGALVEAANEAGDPADYRGRLVAMASALRGWAIENPHEYALIYGSPVPGYAAPQDTIDPAARIPIALLSPLVEHARASSVPKPSPSTSPDLAASLAELLAFVGDVLPAEAAAEGVRAWGEIFGLISLELFGHFNNSITDADAFFLHAMHELANRLFPASS